MRVSVVFKNFCCCCGSMFDDADVCPACHCESGDETCAEQPFCTQCGQEACWGHDDQAEEVAD